MRSLPKVLKYQETGNIHPYEFSALSYELPKIPDPEEPEAPKKLEPVKKTIAEIEEENAKKAAARLLLECEAECETRRTAMEEMLKKKKAADKEEAEALLLSARKEAAEILEAARTQALVIQEAAQKGGYEAGQKTGYEAGLLQVYEEHGKKLDAEAARFLEELSEIIQQAYAYKDEVQRKYNKDLTQIAITVAEKIIQVSLKTSSGIIEKMILSATEKITQKSWAKIYIAKSDASRVLTGDGELLERLRGISEQVKITVLEDEPSGTCIIEMPDAIIDASVKEQLDNIRGLLDGV